MLKNKILVIITGSIAAYKTAYIISRLVQNGYDVEVAATKSALKFIGAATIEGLTHKPVHTDSFETGRMMSHIDLAKWADLVIVVPADANTINKFANGIADNLVTALFLAHNMNKPYIIAPAMNTAMFTHPATQESLKKLSEWGIYILPTDKGYLACGDEGEGKLLNTDLIYGYICHILNKKEHNDYKVLITGGGTIENIDDMRYISNKSSGRTAVKIAEYFYLNGVDVEILLSESALQPKYNMSKTTFDSFKKLKELLESNLKKKSYDLVIHLAAISDFSPSSIEIEGEKISLPLKEKLDSAYERVSLILTKNIKLVNLIKGWSINKDIKLIAFKLLDGEDEKRKEKEIEKLFNSSNSDVVVYNSLSNRENNMQQVFEIIDVHRKSKIVKQVDELAEELYKRWRSE